MDAGRPLSEGNRLQRAYHRWAEPYYARMEPVVREQSILIDRFLYSRRGLVVWLGLALTLVASSAGLAHAGLPWWLAIGASLLLWLGLPLMLLAAWLSPAAFSNEKVRKAVPRIVTMAALGGLVGFAAGFYARHGRLEPGMLAARLWEGMGVLAPAVVLAAAAIVGLAWGVATLRRKALERELGRVRLERERDDATHEAIRARLRLLQGQIQPHFIFNTLAALQHWVDQGDARAAPLLRSLTAFLRGSTEALGRDEVTLDDEAGLVRHYLEVMQARLGARLRWAVQVDPALRALTLPPGLLLTLVENAIEHGTDTCLGGGEVRVNARQEAGRAVIEVADSAGRWSSSSADGVGLANSRARLRHRYGSDADLTLTVRDGCTCATLGLPMTPSDEPRRVPAAGTSPQPGSPAPSHPT